MRKSCNIFVSHYLVYLALSQSFKVLIVIQDVRFLPEFHRVLLEFVFFLVIEEIGFFYSHWMLHHKKVR